MEEGAKKRRRPLRTDARRNYDALIVAAREIFEEKGVDAPLDDVARRAGIGNATMYRHFPTRSDLIAQVYADEVEALCARAETLLASKSARAALFEWLGEFISHVATKRQLALSISKDEIGSRSEQFGHWHEEMRSTTRALLEKVRISGEIQESIEADDLLALASGIALSSADPEQARRLLEIVGNGTCNVP